MDVHAAQHVAPTDHLQVVHDVVVAFGLGLLRLVPDRGRMRAGGEYGEPVWGNYTSQHMAQLPQLGARLRHVDMRLGCDLYLLLQKLALATTEGRRGHRGEQRLRYARRDCFRVGVDEEILLLDTEAKRII